MTGSNPGSVNQANRVSSSVVAVRASGWCAIVHVPSNSFFLLMIGSAANEVTTVLASLGRAFSVRFSLS